MGLLDWLFPTRQRAVARSAAGPGMEVVELAERQAERSFSSALDGVLDDNEDGRNRQQEIAASEVGDEVVLAVEPRPRLQPNAIAVWSPRTGGRLGYLPIDIAAYLSLHMKRYDFRTTITDIRRGSDGRFEADLRIEFFAKAG